jgi:hypothetical protein
MGKVAKIDLDILKRLVAELESSLSTAEGIKTDSSSKEANVEYIVEMQKASGLAAGIMTEARFLVGDIVVAVRGGPAPSEKEGLAKILGVLKGSGGGLPGSN